MSAYVTYSDYVMLYRGTLISETDFDSLAVRATAVIDRITFDRAAEEIEDDDDADTVEKIKLATCAVAEQIQKNEDGAVVQSERVGNFSKTYVVNNAMKLTEEERLARAAKLYLASTDLMYRGFNADEYGRNAIR